ncbi:MAG: hypothetical protein ACXVRH_08835, partial [Thermoleophilaceae bacterium]
PRGAMAVLATVAALAGAALIPGAASAYTYDVTVCDDSPGGTQNNSWSAYSSSPEVVFGQGCPAQHIQTSFSTGLWVRNHQAASWVGSGGLGGWKFTAPAGNNLDSVTATYWTSRANASGMYAGLQDDFALRAGCWPSATELCADQGTNRYIPLSGSSEVRVEVGCLNPAPGCSNASTNKAYFLLYGARVTVNDFTAPAIRPSGDLWTGAWQRGVRGVLVTGLDNADGIQENEIRVDGKTYESQGHACDYTFATPCGQRQDDWWAFDTSALSDGQHFLEAVTYDGARMPTVASGQINVDNHAPVEPGSPRLEGQPGWRSTNDFSVSWTAPAQGSGSPIVAAHYSLCKANDPANCPVADRRTAGDGIEALNHVAVPDPGDYLLRLWLEDRAGNADSAHISDPVHLQYDPTVPGLSAPEARSGWLGAQEAKAVAQAVSLARDARVGPSGIAGYAVTADGTKPGAVPNAIGSHATITLGDLPEGRNLVKARAISGASVPATDNDVGSTEIDVDKTAPEVSVAGAPDPGEWRRGPVALSLTGTDQAQLSGMEVVEYRGDGAQPIDVPNGPTPGVQSQTVSAPVTADGRHTVTFRAVDSAGNSSPEKTIQFKIDQTPPELVAFEAQDPSQPSTISVAVSDRTSGIAGGVIEFRKQGDARWTELATQFGGDHLFATVDDSGLEPGTYEFQATVRDVAGNQTVSNRRRDGQVELLPAPFRFDTRMTAGIVTAASQAKPRKVSARCRRSKKCMAKVRKQRRKADRRTPLVTGTVPTLTVAYGKTAVIKGVLRSSDGQPIPGQAVDVYQRLESTGQPEVRVATVRTSRDGSFEYHAAKGPSRSVRFQFDGSETLHPASSQVKLLVSASSTLRVSRHAVVNGDAVTFSGRVGQPVVGGLKIVDLQAFYRGKWRTFATPRTDKKGSWSYRYRFEATSGLVLYKFRVRVRREASYPYELGYSKATNVTVRGR